MIIETATVFAFEFSKNCPPFSSAEVRVGAASAGAAIFVESRRGVRGYGNFGSIVLKLFNSGLIVVMM